MADEIQNYYSGRGYGREYEITAARKKGGFKPESVSDEARAAGEIRRRIEDVLQGMDLDADAFLEVWE